MTRALSISSGRWGNKPTAPGRAAGRKGSYCVSFVRGARGCRDLCEQWRRLTAGAPPFLQPEFFDLTRPIADPPGDPLLAVAVQAGRVAGVLPLVLHEHGLYPLRSDHSPRFDLWGDSGALCAVWEALQADRRWDHFVLGHVAAESPLATELPMLARRYGCFVKTSPSGRVPYFPLPGFEQRLNSKFRANIRRCTRKAGGLRFERHCTPSRAEFADALAIEALAWKGQAGTSVSSDPRLNHFYRALLRLFGPRGTMSLNFVTVEGRRIACLFTMEDGHTLFAAKIGYDPAYSVISPGHLIVAQTAADAQRRGLRIFDFLGKEGEWKLKWTDRGREHVRVSVHRPSARGYARFAVRKAQDAHLTKNLVAVARKTISRRDGIPGSS